jgi:hypothetical protein
LAGKWRGYAFFSILIGLLWGFKEIYFSTSERKVQRFVNIGKLQQLVCVQRENLEL